MDAIYNQFSVEEILLARDRKPNTASHKELEQALEHAQQQKSTLSRCTTWLNSSTDSLRFFAAQTIYWHCRNKFEEHIMAEAPGLFQFLIELLSSRPKSMAERKLKQVVAILTINAYPNYDFFPELLQRAKIDERYFECLADIPYELGRVPSLSTRQYQFKHHISAYSSAIQDIIIQNLSQDMANFTSFDVFSSFAAISKSFYCSKSLKIIEMGLNLLLEGKLERVEGLYSIISWLEGGVEHLDLSSIFPLMIRLANLTFESRDVESIEDVCRIWRLFADVTCSRIISDPSMCQQSLSSLFKLLILESHSSEEPEVINGIISILDELLAKDNTELLASLHSGVWTEVINWLQANFQDTAESLTYSSHLLGFWTTLVQFLRVPASSLAQAFVTTGTRPNVMVISFIASYQRDLIDEPGAIQLLIKAFDISESPSFTLKSVQRCHKVITANPELLQYTLERIDSAWQIDFEVALSCLEAIMCPAVDNYIIKIVERFTSFPAPYQERLWGLVCDTMLRHENLIDAGIEFVKTLWPSHMAFNMLYEYLSKNLPVKSSMKDILRKALHPSILEYYGKDLNSLWEVLLSRPKVENLDLYIIPLLETITALRHYDAFPTIMVAIQYHPELRPSIFNFFCHQFSTLNLLDEEWLLAVLPIIVRTLRPELQGQSSSTLLVAKVSQRLLEFCRERRSFSDDLLRSIVKYFQLYVAPADCPTRITVLQCCLEAAKEKLTDSQLEILSPLLLDLSQLEPQQFMKNVIYLCGAQKTDLAKKICASRGPRQLATLLLQLKSAA